MKSSLSRIVWECFIDLGITVVYAVIAGLLIVGVVATDDGSGSLLSSALYASLLPAAVLALIAADVVLRVATERRAMRRATGRGAVPHQAEGLGLFHS